MRFEIEANGNRSIHNTPDIHACYDTNGDLFVNGVRISATDLNWLIQPRLAAAWQEGKCPGSGNNPYSIRKEL